VIKFTERFLKSKTSKAFICTKTNVCPTYKTTLVCLQHTAYLGQEKSHVNKKVIFRN